MIEDGRLTTGSYWNPDLRRQIDRPLGEVVDELRSLLSEAVRLRMQSDVPLGALLSGGVDSSIVTALAQRASSQPVKTFSIGFDEAAFDESRYARLVAQHVGSQHHEFRVRAESAIDVLPKLVWYFDEPFADSSAVPTYVVSQLARQHVTVALTGDGGDELFAGYQRYQALRWAERVEMLPLAMRKILMAAAGQAGRNWRGSRSALAQAGPLCRGARSHSPAKVRPLDEHI